ncbi:MAG TPA: NDP-sugar synthase [Pyrinomonadaceae bacterium]|nr:NDP-sugar synthase [Pyrinomonadaceae bacterium]
MILAAGFGTRLYPLTIDRTKPAIPFLGRPLVGYVAEYLARHGFKDVIVNLHHQPESVIKALGDGSEFGVKISYSIEKPNILGTSGALDHARELLGDEAFLVINGKIITEIDLTEVLEFHKKSGAIATMVLRPNATREKFTEVFAENGRLLGFGSNPDPSDHTNIPLMYTGIQILEPKVFDYIPKGIYSDIVPAFYLPALENGAHIGAYISNAAWFELSTLRRYLDISLSLLQPQKVHIGTGCRIDPLARVTSSVIWDNVEINKNALLERTIVADGVSIKENAVFRDCALVNAEMVRRSGEHPEKAQCGRFEGDLYVVPL